MLFIRKMDAKIVCGVCLHHVDSLMQLAERVHDIPIASVEHDGVVFWFKRESYNEANLMAKVRRPSPSKRCATLPESST